MTATVTEPCADIRFPMLGYETTIEVPELDDVRKTLFIPACDVAAPPKAGEIVCVASGVYEAVKPGCFDGIRYLTAQLAHDVGVENLWLLPSRPRLPYPYAPFYAVASMFKTEKLHNRKADWLLWIDDDVVVGRSLYRLLRAAADPETRPFMAAVGVDRFPPFRVAVWQKFDNGAGLVYRRQWVAKGPEGDPYKLQAGEMWMPTQGTHEVSITGLCAALFHRSLFDKVKQPWFTVLPGETDENGTILHKINTDTWWCQQLHNAGIKRHVCCDAPTVHLGFPLPVSIYSAPILRLSFTTPGAEPSSVLP